MAKFGEEMSQSISTNSVSGDLSACSTLGVKSSPCCPLKATQNRFTVLDMSTDIENRDQNGGLASQGEVFTTDSEWSKVVSSKKRQKIGSSGASGKGDYSLNDFKL